MQLIICPSCQHPFEPSDAIRDEVEKEFRLKQAEIEKNVIVQLDNTLHEISKILRNTKSSVKIPAPLKNSFDDMYSISSALVAKINKKQETDRAFFKDINDLKDYLLHVARLLQKHVNSIIVISTVIYNSDLI